MASIEKVVIQVTGDTKGIDSTITELKKVGKVDKENARIFEETTKKRNFLLNRSIKRLKELELQRKKAFNPADIRSFDAAISNVNKDIETLGGNVKKADTASDKFGKTVGKLGAVLLGAFAIGSIVSFTKHLFELAVESEVFEKRARKVFGNSIEIVEEFAESSANALGLTRVGFLGAAAAVGDILVPLGITRERAAELSIEAVRLGGALREFTGDSRSAAEISQVVAKSLTGETEGLKTLGVTVDQTSKSFKNLVLSKQAELGLTRQQAKAETILQIALEGSKDALEEFENNADSLVRQQAELDAKTEELADGLAHLLTPAFLAVSKAANQTVSVLNEVANAEASAFEKFLAFTDITGAGIIKILQAQQAREALAETTEELTDHEEEAVVVVKEHAITIGELKLEMAQLKVAQDALVPGTIALAENQARIREIQEILRASIVKTLTPIEALNKRISQLKKELQSQALAGDIAADTLDEYKSAVRRAEEAVVDLDLALEDALKTLPLMNTELEELFIFDAPFIENTSALEDFFEKFRDEISATIEAEQTLARILSQISVNQLIDIDNRESKSLKALDKLGLREEELAERRLEIQTKSDEERSKILQKQARNDKRAALFDATINNAIAITKALATTANPAFALLIGALGLAEIAAIANQPIPTFHEGKKPELKSGEMFAKILKTEAVIPPKQSAENKGLIDSMIDGNLQSYVFKQYQLPLIKSMSRDKYPEAYDDVLMWKESRKQNALTRETNGLIRTMTRAMEPGNSRRSWR